MRRVVLILLTSFVGLWGVPPLVLRAASGLDPLVTLRAASFWALVWAAASLISAGLLALSLGRAWAGARRGGLWVLLLIVITLLLWVGVPFFDRLNDPLRPPLIVLRTPLPEPVLLWLMAASAGSALVLLLSGALLQRAHERRRQRATLDRLMHDSLEEGIALLDSKLGLVWHNRVAAAHLLHAGRLDSGALTLARRARDIGKLATQGITVGEARVTLSAIPLDVGYLALLTRPQMGGDTRSDFYERFMRRIVHDMRNPLAAIIAHASNLQTAPDFDRSAAERTARTIETEAHRLTRLVDGILFDARLSHMPLALARLDLTDLLEEVYYQYDERAEQEGKHLQFDTPPGAMVIEGDRDLLVRAVGNLVDNALKYSPSGATVRIEGESRAEHYLIKVNDTGEGIPPEYLPDRIFEALVRVRPRDGVSGSGLGLNIVKKIAQLHGGAVQAESQLGRGTTMTLLLPRPG